MPIYEYQCSNCGHTLDELQTMSEPQLVKCPKCGKDTLKRLIGTGGGLIFKGSGFYLTDYKNSKPDKSKTSEKKEAGKTDSNPATKTISEKSETKSGEPKSGKTTETKSSETKSSSKTNSGKN